MSERYQNDFEKGVAVAERQPKVDKPRLYIVMLLNDDYTPMDFVVAILVDFFGMSKARAMEIMLQVHQQGKGICGKYSRDVAETKVMQVNEYARSHQFPLLCVMEAE